jgi:UDP-3-O-[3-hydroxymyristoyl] glucosamine N-acyltransferase
VSGGTLVAKSITAPGTYTAVFPMQPHAQWLKNAALLRHLDELMERVRGLENKAKELGKG